MKDLKIAKQLRNAIEVQKLYHRLVSFRKFKITTILLGTL